MDDFDAASAGSDGTLDADLMAFAARRRQRREEREAKLEASLQAASAPKGADAGRVEFIEVVSSPVEGAVKVDVDVVDAASGTGAGSSPPESAGEPLVSPVERDDYAVKRVAELSEQLAHDSSFTMTDEVRREADEARKINIAAQDSAKKAREGAAAKPGAKKPAAAAKSANTETKAAVKQAQ
jgi:hypothetical protein